MSDIFDVKMTTRAVKQLKKLPIHISLKLQAWIDDIGFHGLNIVRKVPGYHDEPLKGQRQGQRSIRLNRSYRAIYIVDQHQQMKFIEIIDVNNHEY